MWFDSRLFENIDRLLEYLVSFFYLRFLLVDTFHNLEVRLPRELLSSGKFRFRAVFFLA